MQPGSGNQDGQKKEAQIIKLLMNGQGYPMLLSWEVINCERLAYKKSLIGKFMSEMYCK